MAISSTQGCPPRTGRVQSPDWRPKCGYNSHHSTAESLTAKYHPGIYISESPVPMPSTPGPTFALSWCYCWTRTVKSELASHHCSATKTIESYGQHKRVCSLTKMTLSQQYFFMPKLHGVFNSGGNLSHRNVQALVHDSCRGRCREFHTYYTTSKALHVHFRRAASRRTDVPERDTAGVSAGYSYEIFSQ